MNIDFKITTWERVTVPIEHEKKVLKAIKKSKITCSNDIFDIIDNINIELLDEVTEQMTVKENEGNSTIEVMDDNGKIIWSNSK